MSKKLTNKKFIEKAKLVHGDKYDYSKVEYINSKTKVCIICSEHGEFWQTPSNHISDMNKCPLCSHQSYPHTNESFIKKAKIIHGDKYDYSKVDYVNNKTKVCIIHKECEQKFLITPDKHINSKQGCPQCYKKIKLTNKKFIEKAKLVHRDKYDYSKSKYKNYDTKICIICSEHGEFWQTPHAHLNKQGCSKCYGNNLKNTKYFLNKALKIHGDKYDYSKVEYINSMKKVCVICPKHGEFWQTPNNHISQKQGCPKCAFETNISELRLLNNIKKHFKNIIHQYKADWLGKKSIDIFLPDYNIAIEYQGAQHFRPINRWGGNKNFEKNIKSDKEKFELCKKNNVKLFYFTYERKKDIPTNYLDKIFIDENDLITEIKKYIDIKDENR